MKRYKFIGDPKEYNDNTSSFKIIEGDIFNEKYIPREWDLTIAEHVEKYPEDWEEVTDEVKYLVQDEFTYKGNNYRKGFLFRGIKPTFHDGTPVENYKEIYNIKEITNNVKDNINPEHYTQSKIECIDAMESATTFKGGIESICVGNVIKYLWRYEYKNGIEDVKKAKWYLEKLIKVLEEDETNS